MKKFVWVLLAIAVFSFAHAAYDEWRGEAVASAPSMSGVVLTPDAADKARNPHDFRNLMNYEWMRGGMWLALAAVFWVFTRNSKSTDSLWPQFTENSEPDKSGKQPDDENGKRHEQK